MTDFEAYQRSPRPYGPWSAELVYGRRWREWQSDGYIARFDGADLRDAEFSGAGLTGASFRGARLDGANFQRANLSRADFTEARGVAAADFQDVCFGRHDEVPDIRDLPRFDRGIPVNVVADGQPTGWRRGALFIKVCPPDLP